MNKERRPCLDAMAVGAAMALLLRSHAALQQRPPLPDEELAEELLDEFDLRLEGVDLADSESMGVRRRLRWLVLECLHLPPLRAIPADTPTPDP